MVDKKESGPQIQLAQTDPKIEISNLRVSEGIRRDRARLPTAKHSGQREICQRNASIQPKAPTIREIGNVVLHSPEKKPDENNASRKNSEICGDAKHRDIQKVFSPGDKFKRPEIQPKPNLSLKLRNNPMQCNQNLSVPQDQQAKGVLSSNYKQREKGNQIQELKSPNEFPENEVSTVSGGYVDMVSKQETGNQGANSKHQIHKYYYIDNEEMSSHFNSLPNYFDIDDSKIRECIYALPEIEEREAPSNSEENLHESSLKKSGSLDSLSQILYEPPRNIFGQNEFENEMSSQDFDKQAIRMGKKSHSSIDTTDSVTVEETSNITKYYDLDVISGIQSTKIEAKATTSAKKGLKTKILAPKKEKKVKKANEMRFRSTEGIFEDFSEDSELAKLGAKFRLELELRK